MAEYIEREKLNQYLHETMSAQTTTAGMAYVRDLWNKVLSVPAADAAPVVRCRECIHRDGTPGQPNILCFQMKDDDFCSYGKRR